MLCSLLSNYTWTISSLVSQKAISTDERDNKQIQWVSETWQQAGSYHKRRRASHPKGGMYKITQQPLAFGLRHLFLAQIPIHTNKICVCALTYKYIYVCMCICLNGQHNEWVSLAYKYVCCFFLLLALGPLTLALLEFCFTAMLSLISLYLYFWETFKITPKEKIPRHLYSIYTQLRENEIAQWFNINIWWTFLIVEKTIAVMDRRDGITSRWHCVF